MCFKQKQTLIIPTTAHTFSTRITESTVVGISHINQPLGRSSFARAYMDLRLVEGSFLYSNSDTKNQLDPLRHLATMHQRSRPDRQSDAPPILLTGSAKNAQCLREVSP